MIAIEVRSSGKNEWRKASTGFLTTGDRFKEILGQHLYDVSIDRPKDGVAIIIRRES